MANELAAAMGRLMFRGMDMLRHRDAFDIGAPTGSDFSGFDRARQIVLVTFKRSGEAMPSPINHGLADGKLYVRTDASTGKVKRLRNNPRVVVVPSDIRGKPKGQPVAGVARILAEDEHARAEAVIAANWTPAMRVFERTLDKGSAAFDIPTTYIEITPAPTA
ncbi:PPOX class F420-dependent enzyme [Mycobacterium sp. CBMA 234]|uniref:PPOX class F420-dependent oxidoreductase n=1 Tax=Mycolicibacterium sp. CBMA 234 TaxID=1918495 RepID=UPI001EE4503C|nr:PPOX class F420-dependent oxidoreductase [Mycolicibacterium sp. CBMA 234]MUL66216.1 PPOX class F420-dependent enzyme [Mycolicibacterium sp. CBMA 234]